jgi:catechol 2,3-dioxygenase-like lactoylglutathione lyase family enzyme
MKRELDHVGVAVSSLDRGRDAYARLGFQLTARSLHSGSRVADAPVEPWGSGNHCAMFRDGYLEIIGLTDASMYSSVKDMVARYEGLHIVAIGCGNVAAAYAEFRKVGAPVEAPRALERDAAFGPGNKETRRAQFRNMYVDRQQFIEGRFIFIEHVTPDVLWQPHLLAHPNGALGIDAVYFVVADPEATARKFAPLFSDQIERFPGVARLALDRGAMWLTEQAQWRERVPGSFVPPVPSPAGFGVRVESLDATRRYLESNGVSVHAGMKSGSPASLWVAPEDACGAAIQFLQTETK